MDVKNDREFIVIADVESGEHGKILLEDHKSVRLN